MPSFFAHTANFWGMPYFFFPQFLQTSAKFLLISAPVNNLSTPAQYTPLFSILLEIWLLATLNPGSVVRPGHNGTGNDY